MKKKKEYCSLGIMSGTSLDGLDFSFIKTDGISNIKIIFNQYYKFNEEFKNEIKNLIIKLNNSDYEKALNSEEFISLNKRFSDLIIKKTKIFLSKNSLEKSSLDVIGLHGNTILHRPENGISIQLGDPIYLSKKLMIDVIANFRKNDIKNLGQGAPLVPIYHQCQFGDSKNNIMVVNIGGISNFSYLVGKNKFFASDIGPGNKLIDEYCEKNMNCNFDKNGKLSSKGELLNDLVNKWKKKKFLKLNHPTSFDNFSFKVKDFVRDQKENHFDILRTLTFFSAFIISNLTKKNNYEVNKWIFTGGGVRNETLMNDLKSLLGESNIYSSEDYNVDPFFVESIAFAFISVRTLKNLPSTFPSTTGCEKSSVSGNLYSYY